MGEGFFKRASADYSRIHPSVSGDLTHFGRNFPSFLECYPPAGELAYLPDVARLEWLCYVSYRAPLALERLARLPPERYNMLRFKLHTACRPFASRYPIDRIRRICQLD